MVSGSLAISLQFMKCFSNKMKSAFKWTVLDALRQAAVHRFFTCKARTQSKGNPPGDLWQTVSVGPAFSEAVGFSLPLIVTLMLPTRHLGLLQ
jgi:hypothetical protein